MRFEVFMSMTGEYHTGAACAHSDMVPIVDHFHREGFALVPRILEPECIAELKQACDHIFSDPDLRRRSRHGFPFVASRLYELDARFARLAVHAPIFSVIEHILGPGFQLCGQNIIRNAPGEAITTFHIDDVLEFPLPPEVSRHDPRVRMPVHWLAVQLALTDIDSEEYGPGQFIPGSHYSGRQPNDPENPVFEGRGPVSVLCRAGDMYLLNPQCWHRGAPNRSNRTRYIFNIQYAVRWAAARFHPPVQPHLRAGVLANADERMKQVLGAVNIYPTDDSKMMAY
jgi:hypothetical protein